MHAHTRKLKGLTCGILIAAALIFVCANTASAYPLTNPTVSWNTQHWASFKVGSSSASWYTEYFLYADEFKQFDADGTLDAFCVENADVVAQMSYELIPVPQDNQLQMAAKVASQYFTGNTNWSKSATQIAIWEIMFETDSNLNIYNGYFQYTGSLYASAQNILNQLSELSTISTVALAHSPIGSTGVQSSQDYLVAAAVPEPSALFFMGTGLIGLAGIRRKYRSKKS